MLAGAARRLQAAPAVTVEHVLHHGPGLEHAQAASGHHRHLADRVHGPPLGARPVPPGEVDTDDFVGDVQLLAEPDDAKAPGRGDVVDSEHGIGPDGLRIRPARPGQRERSSISRRRKRSHCSTWPISMYSFGWWAWSMEPGPQTTVENPASWNWPASAA